jgi:hypothetical protein
MNTYRKEVTDVFGKQRMKDAVGPLEMKGREDIRD